MSQPANRAGTCIDTIFASLRAEFDRLRLENETLRYQVTEYKKANEVDGNELSTVSVQMQDREEEEEEDNQDSVERHVTSAALALNTHDILDVDEWGQSDMSIFVGQWRDLQDGFFGGTPIQITEDAWRPSSVENPLQKDAQFTCELVESKELRMLERRVNGDVRTFRAVFVPADKAAGNIDQLAGSMRTGTPISTSSCKSDDASPKLVISLDGTDLKWELHRNDLVTYSEGHMLQPYGAQAPDVEQIAVDDPAKEKARKLANNALLSWQFEVFIGAVIIANAALIGEQSNYELANPGAAIPNWMRWLDSGFLAVYTCELTFRLCCRGWQVVRDRGFQFDVILVAIGCVGVVFDYCEFDAKEVKRAMVFRVLRLSRLLRLLKTVTYFKVFWRLSMGLLTSFSTVFSTMAMIFLILYLFALVGIEFISKDTSLLRKVQREDEFDSLPSNMMTLFQFVTMDSLSQVYRPLIEERPWLLVYFVPLFMFLSITLLNLVTAVTVEVAFEMTQNDRDFKQADLRRRHKQLEPIIREWFTHLDAEHTGLLKLKQFTSVQSAQLPVVLEQYMTVNSADDLFEVLDMDGDGVVTENEFVYGVLNFADCGAASTETVLLLKIMKMVREALRTGVIRGAESSPVLSNRRLEL